MNNVLASMGIKKENTYATQLPVGTNVCENVGEPYYHDMNLKIGSYVCNCVRTLIFMVETLLLRFPSRAKSDKDGVCVCVHRCSCIYTCGGICMCIQYCR